MVLKLHAEAPVVKGYLRSCIYDLPRKTYDYIPNEITDKIIEYENISLDTINVEFDDNEKEWLGYFIEKEYAFLVDDSFAEYFPKINFLWQSPSVITSTIIDVEPNSPLVSFKYLEQLNCKHLLLRFLKTPVLQDVIDYLEKALKDLTFKSVSIVLKKNDDLTKKEYSAFSKRIFTQISQTTSLTFHEEKIQEVFVPKLLVNIDLFSEGQSYNTYFNKKLYISADGSIKNSVEDELIHGNINDVRNINDLQNLIQHSKFKRNGFVKKDNVLICKDCELRYMCIDNRIPIQLDSDTWYFDVECSYNPYIAKWKGEEGYMSIKETGVVMHQGEVKINHEKIDLINQILWG